MSMPGQEVSSSGPGVAPFTLSLCLLDAEETLRKSVCDVVPSSLPFIVNAPCVVDLYNGANIYLI